MSDQKTTPFDVRCEILADLWMNYRDEESFTDFIQYNDIGLPASFLISEDLAKPSEKLELLVNETFVLLTKALDIEDDTGFESLDDMLVG
jgi:hypothetical protein